MATESGPYFGDGRDGAPDGRGAVRTKPPITELPGNLPAPPALAELVDAVISQPPPREGLFPPPVSLAFAPG